MHTLMTHKQHAQIMVLLQWEISQTPHNILQVTNNWKTTSPDIKPFFWLTEEKGKKRRNHEAPVEILIMLKQCHCKGMKENEF